MALGDSDFPTPIPSQVPPGPRCQKHECRLDDRAHGNQCMQSLRQEPSCQPGDWSEKQHQRRDQHNLMEPRRGFRFRTPGGRGVSARYTPIHRENDPKKERGKTLLRRSGHGFRTTLTISHSRYRRTAHAKMRPQSGSRRRGTGLSETAAVIVAMRCYSLRFCISCGSLGQVANTRPCPTSLDSSSLTVLL